MTGPLFAYPKQAEFNQVVPKSKIYEHARPSRSVRELFVDQIDRIVWKYKLSPETVNLPAHPGAPEIQVFAISLRTGDLSESVLRTIDKAIPSPIIFELLHGERIKSKGAYKRASDADASKWVVDAYFESPWLSATDPREPLPVALDLFSLYEQVLRRHMPFPALPGECLRGHVERINSIYRKQAEFRKLEVRLQQERQFNRKVELNRELRELKNELNSLVGLMEDKELDTSWTS